MANDLDQVMDSVPLQTFDDSAVSLSLQQDIQNSINEFISGSLKFANKLDLDAAHAIATENVRQLFNEGFIQDSAEMNSQVAKIDSAQINYLSTLKP